VVRAQVEQDLVGLSPQLLRLVVDDHDARGHHPGPPIERSSVVLGAEVPFQGVDLPGHRDVVEPGIGRGDESAGAVPQRDVPPWYREAASLHQRTSVRLRDGAHPGADLPQHLARQRAPAAASGCELGVQLGGRAPPALDDLGEGRAHLGAIARSTGEVDRGSADGCQRPTSRGGGGQSMSSFDEHSSGSQPAYVGGHQHVDRTRRAGHSPHPVQLQGIQPGEHAYAAIEDGGPPPVVPGGWPVVQRHNPGQQPTPRSPCSAAVADGAAGEARDLQVGDPHDRAAPEPVGKKCWTRGHARIVTAS